MSQVNVDEVMAGLKEFQRDAVDHVIDRFYGNHPGASGRFLIADETGLGKSVIARGVIARAIEHLETVDDVKRIDVVYICSNVDLAGQNLKRLNVTDNPHIGMATRLTMLARESSRLSEAGGGIGKKVNLVSFTPGTSFSEGGFRQGSAEERAMITIILDQLVNRTTSDRRVTRMLFQGTVSSAKRFDERYVKPLHAELRGAPDPRIVNAFRAVIEAGRALDDFLVLREDGRNRSKLNPDLKERAADLMARLRHDLSKAGVETLEPDLIILDEFQRFRQLLADAEPGSAGDLAHSLFNYPDAKVLLLSATPYKPFTDGGDAEDDHYRDFLATVHFLAKESNATTEVRSALEDFRRALVSGEDASDAAHRVRERLLPLMSRSERPQLADQNDLLSVRELNGGVPTADDLRDWSSLRALGREVSASVDIEYWKSIPYFASFMEGYKTATKLHDALDSSAKEAARSALLRTRGLSRDDIEGFAAIDLGNGYLRALNAETVGAGWWKMLWLPPSMPYLKPGRIYEPLTASRISKRVVFSAWSGVPTSVASLLSYEADRLGAASGQLLLENTAIARKAVAARLTYAIGPDGRAADMSTLALFWPHPTLAIAGDPLRAVRSAGRLLSADDATAAVRALLPSPSTSSNAAWEAFFSSPGALPEELEARQPQWLIDIRQTDDSEDDEATTTSTRLVEHVRLAMERMSDVAAATAHPDLASLAIHSPGNISYRALKSIAGPSVSDAGLWQAAWTLAAGLRSLFNRKETIALIVGLFGDDPTYWRSVLDYCADGNLQAVLDEYLFQLRSDLGVVDVDDVKLSDMARTAAGALSLRAVRYSAREATPERREIRFNARFALRYGGRSESDASDAAGARQSEVRAAFNSPFAPFVLASTSVGQEGIDFHWWCHSVTHWNLPGNPVDFEQREGRVNRFAGHAVRKNVAAAHWNDVLGSPNPSPWAVAFEAASKVDNGMGEFSPWWVYPGEAKIERVVARYPLSRDIPKYDRLRDALALYRLTLGQPRQEDMLALLRARGGDVSELPTIDLRPPRGQRAAAS
ncbi:MAG TPA: hypothetical protein VHZ98_06760 [Galbitalea sp.]|jgi:hypothetical protein|nr:hypothetical protein [Galbitalea sp.]